MSLALPEPNPRQVRCDVMNPIRLRRNRAMPDTEKCR